MALLALLLVAMQATEQVAPGHAVYLRPGGLVALDPDGDRFDLELTRGPGGPASYRLLLALRSPDGPLVQRTLDVPARDGHAAARIEALLPLSTLRHCRPRSLLPRWECAGFTLDVELRDPDGALVYALHDPERVVGISWTGLLDRLAWPLTLGGVALGLLLVRRDWGRTHSAELRAFDALALLCLLPVPAAFSAFPAPAVPLLALALAATPASRRASAGAALLRPRLVALSPALVAAVLALLGSSFHFALMWGHDLRPIELDPHLGLIAGLYLLLGGLASWWLHAAPRSLLGPLLLALLLGTLRRIDAATFLLTGGHADGELWRHLFHATNLTMASSPLLLGLLASLLLELALVFGLLKLARRAAGRGPLLQAAPIALLAVATVQIALRAGPPPRREISDTVREAFAALPEWAMARPLLAAAVADETPPPPLDLALREKLQYAGIRPGALRADYPLLRPSIHLTPPADRDAPRVPPGTNVIVVLVESLSGGLLEHGVPGLTPNLDAFAAESLSLDQLWAAEFPTLRGELAALGSFAFGADAGGTLLPGRSPTEARLLTLADVLRAHGYSTVHAQSDHGTFAGTSRLLLRSGWDRALSADDPGLLRGAVHPVEKTWGLYDEDLFRGVTRLLEDGALRPPFLLTLATTDTHYPYAVLHRHPAAGGNDLLDALHSTDAGFGLFWDRFRRSPRAADTLVLVTADHALAGRTLRRSGGTPRLSQFDRLAGWLYVPGTERWRGTRSDVLCSQLDLTPTLLDVLGLDAENPFLGLSVFSDRPAHPLLPGREQPPLDRLAPGDRARLAAVGWTDDDQACWLAYLTQLARADRIRP